MNSRLWLISAILALALATAEFIKQNYSRVVNTVTELVHYIHASIVYTSSMVAEYLTWHKHQVVWAIAIIVICRMALAMWRLHLHIIGIVSNFHLAEAELNTLIRSYRAEKGRLSRSKERADWYRDIAKKEPPLFNLGDPFPRTVSDQLIETNEAEIQSKRNKKNDCVMTAFLLAQLYRAAPEAARTKIEAERKRGATPYVAAGIESLSHEHWRFLRYAVRKWGFP
jgi:hypothetical protein